MIKKSLWLIAVIFLLSACSDEVTEGEPAEIIVSADTVKEEDEEVGMEEEEEVEAEPQAVPLTDEEAKEKARTLFQEVARVMEEMGEKHQFHPGNPGDYEVLKPALAPFMTEALLDGKMRDVIANYYCDCDARMLPKVEDAMIRIEIEHVDEDTFVHKGIILEDLFSYITHQSILKFAKEDGEWKVEDWEADTLEGADLALLPEEIEFAHTIYQGSQMNVLGEYDSSETGKAAYNVDGSYGVGISDGRISYDIPEITAEETPTTVTMEMLEEEIQLFYQNGMPEDVMKVVEELTGPVFASVQENMQLVGAEPNAEMGTVEFKGGVQHNFTFQEAMVSYSPVTRNVYVATIVDAKELRFFTNDPEYAERMPESFITWSSRFAHYPVYFQ